MSKGERPFRPQAEFWQGALEPTEKTLIDVLARTASLQKCHSLEILKRGHARSTFQT
jgi:hypothetical protein